MSEQPTGIFTMAPTAYHGDPCETPSLSASVASTLCSKSPRHAWTEHPKLNPDFKRVDDAKYDVGTAAHALILENKQVDDVIEALPYNDWRTNAAKEARDDARANGKIPLLEKHLIDLIAMLAAMAAQLEAVEDTPPFFTDGKSEQTLIWQEDGVTCRAMLDFLRDDYACIDDLKTTSASADPEKWSRTLFGIGADVQTAFYIRGVTAVTGVRPRMRYVVVETYPPYALSVNELGMGAMSVGERKVDFAIEKWRGCLKKDEWPGYPPKVCLAELPAYEEARWLERMAHEEEVAA